MNRLQMILICLVATTVLSAQDAATETAAGYYNDGLAMLKSKDYGNAVDKMLKAIEIADPEADAKVIQLAKQNGSIGAYYAGNALAKAKKFEEAMAKYEQGIEMNAKSYTNYYGIAKTLDGQDKIAEAVSAYAKAGEVATAAGSADRAEKYMSRAANIIALTYGAKKYDEAIAAGEAYLEAGESADVSYYIAKSLIEKGQGSDAISHAEKASSLGGKAEDGKFILVVAEALEAAGNKSEAAAAYEKVPAGKYHKHAQYKAGQLKS